MLLLPCREVIGKQGAGLKAGRPDRPRQYAQSTY